MSMVCRELQCLIVSILYEITIDEHIADCCDSIVSIVTPSVRKRDAARSVAKI